MQYQFAFGEMIHLSVIEDSIEFTIYKFLYFVLTWKVAKNKN